MLIQKIITSNADRAKNLLIPLWIIAISNHDSAKIIKINKIFIKFNEMVLKCYEI
jgi:hypothetical protein